MGRLRGLAQPPRRRARHDQTTRPIPGCGAIAKTRGRNKAAGTDQGVPMVRHAVYPDSFSLQAEPHSSARQHGNPLRQIRVVRFTRRPGAADP